VYTAAEIGQFAALCKEHNLYLHVDGSRFFNAAAGICTDLKAISTDAGVDILSLGGTKTGMMYGEAVVVFNKKLAESIRYKHKQVMQLASKTRFIAIQFEALFKDDLWRRTALHANGMAQLLGSALEQFPAVRITRPVAANVVFAKIPFEWNEPLMAQFPFYVWREDLNEVRLMCAWDTRAEDIHAFTAAIRGLAG
jgi:threonine aldolase